MMETPSAINWREVNTLIAQAWGEERLNEIKREAMRIAIARKTEGNF